ncbi:hypothetical protein Enr13x_56240 [Stieleria neptunia]|uniref:DUF1552 domain-containing protein n=1 Tax=Stieleria neptunia TaxID=2527979 RepID=A0A518HY13_9BACT|nr:DUF1552 domain-containing protein [Stieleria neptunia]QDV45745.1 hypothetical protein Enr13x_56240 [Stieleria neptunia]
MKWHIDRRTFLRGAAGPLLPLPFLNLMESSASGAIDDAPPLRFVTLFKPNGVHPPSWNINGGTEFDFRMSPLMQPFAKHKDDLLILDNMGDFGFSSHANSTRRFLCGHHQSTKTPSIDQLIADKIGGDTAHRSLELTTEGLFPNQFGCSYISYDQNGDAIPRESDPQLIYDRLFQNPMSNPAKRAEMTSLLDRVAEDARSLQRRAGLEDRQTLDQYLSVVRETEKRIANLQQTKNTIPIPTIERPLAPANLNEQVESMIDLIALALWTDSTRCVTYMLGNSNSRMIFDFLGIKEQHHYLSHFFRNFSRSNLDALLKISLWHMEKFDYLLNKMKSYKDHNGSLLDHSLVLFGSGMGHSDNHTVKRVPIILAGQGGGRLKTGRYVRYAENQQLGRLHLALLQKFGINIDSFGQSNQPLPGLDGSDYTPFRERSFESWVRYESGTITVQGRLRLSEDLNEAKIFYVDVPGRLPVRVEIEFRDFHDFNLAYHCGTPIELTGDGTQRNGQLVITKIKGLRSLFGKKPGTQNG